MGVKQDVLERYETDERNRIVIDVTTARPEDLYDCFDKQAPYLRRDLDQGLADYLIASAKELPAGAPVIIRFTFAATQDEAKYTRIRNSIKGFFNYLAELEREAIAQMVRKSVLLFAVGAAIMFAAVWLRQWLGTEPSVVGEVFAEGLTVAAWVSLWEAVAVFLIEWFPHRRKLRRLERISQAEVLFSFSK